MELYDTGDRDKWICHYCKPELEQRMKDENWRLVLEKLDPELRCSECAKGDLDIED